MEITSLAWSRVGVLAMIAMLGMPACKNCETPGSCSDPPPVASGGGGGSPSAAGGSAGQVISAADPCSPKEHDQIDFEPLAQEKSLLCWAASEQMVAQGFGISDTQCEQIKARDSSCPCTTCPDSAGEAEGKCNYGGWPNFRRINIDAIAKDVSRDEETIPFDTLKREITCRKRPVVFVWRLGGAAGHIMVAYGYDGDKVLIADPLPACVGDLRAIPYDEFVHGNAPGITSHWRDYYGFKNVEEHAHL